MYYNVGAHVKCLHLVLQWRDYPNEPLRLLKIRNFCSDPKSRQTDSFYTTDCMVLSIYLSDY